MASSDSQIDKPQRGRPKRAELPDVNINTGVQSINSGCIYRPCNETPIVLFLVSGLQTVYQSVPG